MFNKIKKGGKENNYPGYKIVYGSKTVSEIKNAGFIPLTVKWTGKIDVNWGGGERDHHLVINGKRVMKEAVNAGYAQGYYDTNFDLDFYFKGDLTEMKNCTITSTDGDVGGAPGNKTIIKWLEPIGGGDANRLSKWFSRFLQKGGEQYV